jgi:hypothetical protein
MAMDKKRLDGKQNFILLRDIGEAFIYPFEFEVLACLVERL